MRMRGIVMNISLKCLEVNLLFMQFSANVLKDQKIKVFEYTLLCISKFGYLFVYLAFSN